MTPEEIYRLRKLKKRLKRELKGYRFTSSMSIAINDHVDLMAELICCLTQENWFVRHVKKFCRDDWAE